MHGLFTASAAGASSSTLLTVVLVGGIAGFGVYCASHAVQVWRARNAGPAEGAAPSSAARLRRIAGRTAACAVALGLLLLAISYVVGAASRRDGALVGHGLFTPRLPEGLEAAEVTGRAVVEAGEVIARFRSPRREAEVAALKLRRDVLAAERRAALHAPLELDPEVVRRRQELAVERRHLEYSHDQFAPARDLVVREQLRDRLAKQAQVRAFQTDLDRLRREQEQAAARLRLRREQVERAEKLSPTRAAPGQELAERKTELDYQTAEVAKLDKQIRNAEAEVAQLNADLAALDDLTGRQAAAFTEQVKRVRERLAAVPADEAPLEKQLTADAERARARRAAELEKLDLDLARCEAELAGLAGSLAVVAPFAGRVAYRDPSPGAAFGDAPLLVLAPRDAFRLRLRLSGREAGALERAGETTLALTHDGIELRFPGRLTGRRPLPHDGGHVLAELTCDPPAEAAGELAAGKTVSARLLWSPPLYASPLFPPAAALIALGSLGWFAATRPGARGPARRAAPARQADDFPHGADAAVHAMALPAARIDAVAAHAVAAHPVAAHAGEDGFGLDAADDAEFGASGAMLRLTGTRLRQAVLRGRVDRPLLAAAEWSLDRHHARAVRLLGEGLGDDGALADAAAALLEAATPGTDRLASVLRAVGGDRLQSRLRQVPEPPLPAPAAPARRKRDGHGHANGDGHPNGNGHSFAGAAAE